LIPTKGNDRILFYTARLNDALLIKAFKI